MAEKGWMEQFIEPIKRSTQQFCEENAVRVRDLSPGVIWDGPVDGSSGYSKANREILLRVANTLHVELRPALNVMFEDHATRMRLAPHHKISVAPTCPYLRFFRPDRTSPGPRRRIIWTMMETSERVHPDFVAQINAGFDELWTPTEWGLETFQASGLKVEGRIMPLGVNATLYRPLPKKPALPVCTLASDVVRAQRVPAGFVFLTVGLPSFRKGVDVMAQAFEQAFAGRDDVHLLIATTHSSVNVDSILSLEKYKSNIWTLTGELSEHQMVKLYNAADAYVTASRGEGWNLGICEAAACGLPVIAPAATSHNEVTGGFTWLFGADGTAEIPGAESVSPWYEGMKFTHYGDQAIGQLADCMKLVERRGPSSRDMAELLRRKVTTDWTWDKAADRVVKRLLEVQG